MSRKYHNTGKTLYAWFWALFFALPLLLLLVNSFKTKSEIMISSLTLPSHLYLENYKVILSDSNFTSSFLCSCFMVVVTTSLTILIASMTGYSLSRWKSPFSGAFSLIISSTLFVPFQVYMVSLIVVVNRIGLTGNILGLILVYIALGMPVPVFLCLNYVKTLPKDMEEAATIDGCSRSGIFFYIIFPVMKPIAATVAVLNGLWVWGEFLVAFLVYGNHKPMTLPLSQQYFYGTYSNQWNLILAGFVICAVPVVIFYLVMQKYIIKGVAAGAVKE